MDLCEDFAHHPAQRFDQVRLAAAVRPDHAGQARLDQEIGRFDKRFEADQAQPRQLHDSGLMFQAARDARPKGGADDCSARVALKAASKSGADAHRSYRVERAQ